MFNKKNCPNCKEKLNSKHNFCPNCGHKKSGKIKKENYGMLGKTDSLNEEPQNPLLGGLGGGLFNKMLGSALKMLEKEMQKGLQNPQNMPKTNFKLMVNGKEINFSPAKQNNPKNTKKFEKKELQEFSDKQIKKFLGLPKKEPIANLKRIGDKIIYEIELPDVDSQKDIIINTLENSIEIKAIGKNEAYFKVIPISMPITSRKLDNGKLFLELVENLD